MAEDKLKQVKVYIKGILGSSKNQMTQKELIKLYHEMIGSGIPATSFGFRNVELFLKSLTDTCVVVGTGPYAQVTPILSANSKDIVDMIAKQKDNSKRHGVRKQRNFAIILPDGGQSAPSTSSTPPPKPKPRPQPNLPPRLQAQAAQSPRQRLSPGPNAGSALSPPQPLLTPAVYARLPSPQIQHVQRALFNVPLPFNPHFPVHPLNALNPCANQPAFRPRLPLLNTPDPRKPNVPPALHLQNKNNLSAQPELKTVESVENSMIDNMKKVNLNGSRNRSENPPETALDPLEEPTASTSTDASTVSDFDHTTNYTIPHDVQRKLEDLIAGKVEGLWLRQLPEEYMKLYGEELVYQKYRYKSLVAMCCALPYIFTYKHLRRDGGKLYYAKGDIPKEETDAMIEAALEDPPLVESCVPFVPALPDGIDLRNNPANANVPSFVMTPGDTIPVETLPDCEDKLYIPISIGEIYDLSNFWFCREDKENELQSLYKDIASFYNANYQDYIISRNHLAKGLHVIFYKAADEYHRAFVVKFDEHAVKVFRIDDGTVETTALCNLYFMHKNFCDFPRQGIRGRLAWLTPPVRNAQWSRAAAFRLVELCWEKIVHASIVSTDDAQSDTIYDLILCDATQEEDVFIHDVLIAEGHAIGEDQEQKEPVEPLYDEYEPIVPNLHLYPLFVEIEMGMVPTALEMRRLVALDVPLYEIYPFYFRRIASRDDEAVVAEAVESDQLLEVGEGEEKEVAAWAEDVDDVPDSVDGDVAEISPATEVGTNDNLNANVPVPPGFERIMRVAPIRPDVPSTNPIVPPLPLHLMYANANPLNDPPPRYNAPAQPIQPRQTTPQYPQNVMDNVVQLTREVERLRCELARDNAPPSPAPPPLYPQDPSMYYRQPPRMRYMQDMAQNYGWNNYGNTYAPPMSYLNVQRNFVPYTNHVNQFGYNPSALPHHVINVNDGRGDRANATAQITEIREEAPSQPERPLSANTTSIKKYVLKIQVLDKDIHVFRLMQLPCVALSEIQQVFTGKTDAPLLRRLLALSDVVISDCDLNTLSPRFQHELVINKIIAGETRLMYTGLSCLEELISYLTDYNCKIPQFKEFVAKYAAESSVWDARE